MSFAKVLRSLSAAALMGLAGTTSADIVTQWDFQNVNTVVATGNSVLDTSPTPTIGVGTAKTLGMTNTYGTPGPSVDISDVFETTGISDQGSSDPTAPALNNIWRVRGGEPTGGTQAANGWSSLAPAYTQGAEFDVSTTGFTNIKTSYDWLPTNRGVADQQLQYTTDGTHWTNVGPVLVATASKWMNQNTFDFSNTPGVSNNPNFGIRMVSLPDPTKGIYIDTTGTALNNNSGNWRFDMVTVSGTAVPEPATASLAVLAGAGLIARRRRA